MKYLQTHSVDPEYNLAFEEYCFKNLPLENESYFFLWINSPAIIVGKNQNAYAEINLEYVQENNIKLVRRITGGGAVYHDLGNLNFSFIEKNDDSKKIDFKKYYSYIIKALRDLGLDAQLSGRNDVTIDGKKCIGASQAIWENRVLSNGCILFDVKLDALSKALTVRPEKLKAKGVKSVSARVENILQSLKNKISIEQFKDHLLKSIFEQRGEKVTEYKLSEPELLGIKKIYDTRFSLKSWNYGKSPNTKFKNYKYFPQGAIEIFFDVENNRIQNLKILGDFFSTSDITELENLVNGSNYEEIDLAQKLSKVNLEKYFGSILTKDFVSMFFHFN